MNTLLPLLGFVVAATCTPGPNNLMVLASGANFGLGRTLPHIVGITIGFPVMMVAVGLGLGFVFEVYPVVTQILKYAAFVYLLWLAWQIASAGRPDTNIEEAKPLTVLQAAAFQWVNPKGWAFVLAAMALYTTGGGDRVVEVLTVAGLFAAVAVPNLIVWTLFGRAIAGFLQDDRHRLWFNIAMAVLLVVSVAPTLFE